MGKRFFTLSRVLMHGREWQPIWRKSKLNKGNRVMILKELSVKTALKKFSMLGVLCGSFWVPSLAVADGQQVFENVCASCHTGGFKGWVSGAPDVRDAQEWAPYLQRDSLEVMRRIVVKGNADHKPKGDCEDCTEAEVIQAIDYLLSKVSP